jgi:hypothetical protein
MTMQFAEEFKFLLFWGAALLALTVLALWALAKIRVRTLQQEPGASEMLEKFRELHAQGVLSDAEFRTIRTQLAAKQAQQLKDNGETG